MKLPEESGTIEFRTDGNITVSGHRVRLKTVAEEVFRGKTDPLELREEFPTISQALLERVVKYIQANEASVREHLRQEDRLFDELMTSARKINLEELRQLTDQE